MEDTASDVVGGLFGGIFVVFFMSIAFIVQIAFCSGVYQDAKHRKTLFVGPRMWAFATLLGGVFTAVAYWAIHLSTLCPREEVLSDSM